MNLQPIGNQWLKDKFKLSTHQLTHASYLGTNESIEINAYGNTIRVYGLKYKVAENDPMHHLIFSLKHDDLNLEFFKDVFGKIPITQLEEFISKRPTGKYERKIGFLFEFLTGGQIKISKPITGNYVNLQDEKKNITGQSKMNSKWKINDNLLGTREYCPVIRKTKELDELLSQDIAVKIKRMKQEYPVEVFKRAVNYLYHKETKSTYEIEKEQPSPDRMEKFVNLLTLAGTEPHEEIISLKRLIQLQNIIVDPRYAASSFRNFQNYVGENFPNSQERIHYICPPPSILPSLMYGLHESFQKTQGTQSEVRATILSFGFVFIHPFEDGNGRLHRFLIHDSLAHDKVVPHGLVIPVSAHMLNHIDEYDQALETYSKPLMQRIKFERDSDGEIQITNGQEVEGYFRFPDLTKQCVYLLKTIHATLDQDMPEELLFIQRYDEAKKELQRIVDMPDKFINSMLLFLHQNKGIFPKRRREYFAKLTSDEILKMQVAFRRVFEIDT